MPLCVSRQALTGSVSNALRGSISAKTQCKRRGTTRSIRHSREKDMDRNMRRLLICPNAFKGSLTAMEAARAIEAGLKRGLAGMAVESVCLPVADGGDGTLETLVEATNGTLHHTRVRGPLGRDVDAYWGRLGGIRHDTAIIEMAQASGLRLLSSDEYDPRVTTTYGVGQLMLAAVDAGCATLLLGIGGSATNDGGAGMAQALGASLRDAEGQELEPGGLALQRLARLDRAAWKLPPHIQVRAACDVDNPLCGMMGASAIYGPQKGADAAIIRELDAALSRYADLLETHLLETQTRTRGMGTQTNARQTGQASYAEEAQAPHRQTEESLIVFSEDAAPPLRDVPGAGAAGGLGAGLLAWCGADLLPGTELVLDVIGFDRALQNCDLVITGEGRLDSQTLRGKVVAGVIQRAKAAGKPVIALAGSVEEGAEAILRQHGLVAAFTIVQSPLPVDQAMQNGRTLLTACAERAGLLLRLWAD